MYDVGTDWWSIRKARTGEFGEKQRIFPFCHQMILDLTRRFFHRRFPVHELNEQSLFWKIVCCATVVLCTALFVKCHVLFVAACLVSSVCAVCVVCVVCGMGASREGVFVCFRMCCRCRCLRWCARRVAGCSVKTMRLHLLPECNRRSGTGGSFFVCFYMGSKKSKNKRTTTWAKVNKIATTSHTAMETTRETLPQVSRRDEKVERVDAPVLVCHTFLPNR